MYLSMKSELLNQKPTDGKSLDRFTHPCSSGVRSNMSSKYFNNFTSTLRTYQQKLFMQSKRKTTILLKSQTMVERS